MRRPSLVWVLAASLTGIGSIWAHAVTYSIVAPDAAAHARLLARTGHGYLDQAPFVVGIAVGLVLLVLAFRAKAAARGGSVALPPPWGFAALPVVCFTIQEHLERFIHSGAVPIAAALEPTFLLGIALQLPFALAALLVARLLVGLAEELGRALAQPGPRRPPRGGALFSSCSVAVPVPRPPKLALGWSERGPPPPAA